MLDALLDELLRLGLAQATELLFGGGSAGGLGALAAAERVRARLPALRVFKVFVLSGFFLARPSPRATDAPRGSAASAEKP